MSHRKRYQLDTDDAARSGPEAFDACGKVARFVKIAGSLDPPDIPDPRHEWPAVRRHIENPAPERVSRRIKSFGDSLLGLRRSRVRAVFVPVAAVLVGIWLAVLVSRPNLKEWTAEHGHRLDVTLTDGSRIRLNSGSTIVYPRRFPEEGRKIGLSGEAFFEIQADGRPFIVETENARTTVLGTEFNVWARYGRTRVVVKEGCVRLQPTAPASDSGRVDIATSEMSEVSGTRSPNQPETIDVAPHIGWLNGVLVFERSPLNEVFDELERYYSIRIHVHKDEMFRGATLTGSFEGMSVDSVLSSIGLVFNFKHRHEKGQYILDEE